MAVEEKQRALNSDSARFGFTLNKTARKNLLRLRHFQIRSKIIYKSIWRGVYFHNAGEPYTTKACIMCGHCQHVGASEVYACGKCGFTAPRDVKATIAIGAYNRYINV